MPYPPYTGPELCARPARELVALLRAGELHPNDLIDASLTRVAQTEPLINAMPTLCEDRARAAVAGVTHGPQETRLLAGLPIAIKDLTAVAGVRTTFGTAGLADHVPEQSDPIVMRLETRGAVVLGKTNTPELGAGGNTFNTVFGATRNPWNTALNAGGSSGGAAAGLAAGQIWLSHGSDFAGSLRTPANYCGIVGLRPSPGVARGGPAAMSFTDGGLQGPMARDVLDCALFLDAMAGFDPGDPRAWPAPTVPYRETARQDAGPVRLAYSPDLKGFAAVTPQVDQLLRAALARLNGSGVQVDEDCPDLPHLNETFRALRALSYLGSHQITPPEVSRHFKPTIQENHAAATALSLGDYARAERHRASLFANMAKFFETHDVLACPVNGLFALPVEVEYPTQVAGQPMEDYIDWLRFSFLATTTGLPALALPVGLSEAGLPIALQLIGPPRGEARLLQIAHHIEQVLALSLGPIDPQSPGAQQAP